MRKLVLLRHGQSTWNKENRFTGWKDVGLTEQGEREAKQAGKLLKEEGFKFDMAYTSVLKRAIKTLWIALEEMDQMWIPVIKHWRLNERHYGALQGLNKAETAKKYGEDQVLVWRRSYSTPPPALKRTDKRFPGNDPRYKLLGNKDIPVAECLKDNVARTQPYWEGEILRDINQGKNILITAHGNSLRSIIKILDNVSEEEILKINVPTGVPLVYELDDDLKPIRHYYLGDQDEIKAAMESVANQGKAK